MAPSRKARGIWLRFSRQRSLTNCLSEQFIVIGASLQDFLGEICQNDEIGGEIVVWKVEIKYAPVVFVGQLLNSAPGRAVFAFITPTYWSILELNFGIWMFPNEVVNDIIIKWNATGGTGKQYCPCSILQYCPKAILVSICIRLWPKWNSTLLQGNIVILP